jgi:hypothetical protein
MMSGQKRPPTIKLPELCTIWSCATESDICEALLGKWVQALVPFRQFWLMSMACQRFPLDGSPDSWLTTRNGPGLKFKKSFVSLRGWTWFYLPDRNSGWNIGPSLRSRIKKKTRVSVEAPWLTPSEIFTRVSSRERWWLQYFGIVWG